jgi:hypothetical protein
MLISIKNKRRDTKPKNAKLNEIRSDVLSEEKYFIHSIPILNPFLLQKKKGATEYS